MHCIFQLLLIVAFLHLCESVQVRAPRRCGGSYVVAHTAARFGRKLQVSPDGEPEAIRVYAPLPQDAALTTWDDRRLAHLCTPLEGVHLDGSVVWALRGQCDFATKAVHAQEAGASGLVVVNTNANLVEMVYNATRGTPVVSIPVVMVRRAVWDALARCRKDLSVVLTIRGDMSYEARRRASTSTVLSSTWLPWVILAFSVWGVTSAIATWVHIRQRRREAAAAALQRKRD